jgi:hypothetical protein
VFNVARVSHLWLLLLNSAAEVNKEESFDVSKGNGGNKLTRIEPEKKGRKPGTHGRPNREWARRATWFLKNLMSQAERTSRGHGYGSCPFEAR